MSLSKIKKGDTVQVITGKYKGKIGEVESVSGDLITVTGVNVVKKTVKRDPSRGIEGGFKDITRPINRSNICFYDKKTEKRVKIAVKTLSNGSKSRYNKRTNEEVENG